MVLSLIAVWSDCVEIHLDFVRVCAVSSQLEWVFSYLFHCHCCVVRVAACFICVLDPFFLNDPQTFLHCLFSAGCCGPCCVLIVVSTETWMGVGFFGVCPPVLR